MPSGPSLGGVVAGNGHLVAVGDGGELLIATNSANWQRGVIPKANFFSDAAYGNGLFLAVGGIGEPTNHIGFAMISTNAFDWTTNVIGADWLTGCAFGNGMFVAVGNRTLLSSSDGLNWTSRLSANVLGIYGVDFVGDHFVVLGANGLRMTSSNGINWSAPTTDSGPDLYAATSGNGTTVIVGEAERIITISPTNTSVHPPQVDVSFGDVTYGNGRFVAVGTVFTFGIICTSTNGFDWVYKIFGETCILHRIVFANGEFVAVGEYGTIVSSADGSTWTLRRGGLPAPLLSVAAAQGGVIGGAGAYSAVATVMRLSGDQAWQIQRWDNNSYPTRIIFTDSQFLAVGGYHRLHFFGWNNMVPPHKRNQRLVL